MRSNAAWAEQRIAQWDPHFRHRWVVYEDTLRALLSEGTTWLDLGCGDAGLVARFGTRARRAAALDTLLPTQSVDVPFVCGDIRSLPFRSESADLITLRFVVEHLRTIPSDLHDVVRVLKPGGRLLVLTTNTLSPLIGLPRLLPHRCKQFLLRSLFGVRASDVFPTYHRFNSEGVMRRNAAGLTLERLQYVQDANYARRWVFLLFFGWHLLTRPRRLQKFRTNILAVFVKNAGMLAGAAPRT